MSEITVTIPLSALADVKELTPQGIQNALTYNHAATEQIKGLNDRIDAYKDVIRDFAVSLQQIVESDADAFTKAQQYRVLAQQVKESVPR